MAEYEFTSDDLDALAESLDRVASDLTDREQALLLAVLRQAARTMAGDDAEVTGHAMGGLGGMNLRIRASGSPLAGGFAASFRAKGPTRVKGWEHAPVEDEAMATRPIA